MNNQNTFALKGDICFSLDQKHLSVMENAYVVCEDGLCAGVYRELPDVSGEFPARIPAGR